MGKFNGVLLASDFDDTLCGDGHTVSEENRKAVSYFIREGGSFTVSTGRAYTAFKPCVPLVPINVPVILSNGSALYDFNAGEMVYETFLPERTTADLVELAARFPDLGFEAYRGDDIFLHNPNKVTRAHLKRIGHEGVETPIPEIPGPLSKVLIQHRDRKLLEAARDHLLARHPEEYEAIFSNLVLLELTAKGSNKGGMVLELAKRLGICRRNIYCIGDNENDIPMLACSAIPFAPSNCAPPVKEWGARILGSCEESCVAQAIEILDGIY